MITNCPVPTNNSLCFLFPVAQSPVWSIVTFLVGELKIVGPEKMQEFCVVRKILVQRWIIHFGVTEYGKHDIWCPSKFRSEGITWYDIRPSLQAWYCQYQLTRLVLNSDNRGMVSMKVQNAVVCYVLTSSATMASAMGFILPGQMLPTICVILEFKNDR